MLNTIRKALVAAGFAGVAALGAQLLDGDITTAELLFSLGSGLVAGGATYGVPNAKRRPGVRS